jgi:NAD(P)H-dependent flavin oxidoreductase YrpB (nitropropane dioxygenase family)
MFGIDVPILAFTHCRDVAAAVTKAGGMGVLGAVAHSPEQLEIDLAWIEKEVGGLPYGIDVIVPAKYAGSDEGGYTIDDIRKLIPAEHIAFVDDILRRYDVPPLADDERRSVLGGTSRGDAAVPFSANQADSLLEVALAHRPALVVNALGPPPAHMIERAKQEGRLIGALAGKAQHAERHVNVGVDVIIAQGYEA